MNKYQQCRSRLILTEAEFLERLLGELGHEAADHALRRVVAARLGGGHGAEIAPRADRRQPRLGRVGGNLPGRANDGK